MQRLKKNPYQPDYSGVQRRALALAIAITVFSGAVGGALAWWLH